MKKLLVVAILLVAGGYWANLPGAMPSSTLDQYKGERRVGESVAVGGECPEGRCLLVYVAPWCGSCKRMTPVIDDLAKELRSEGVPVSIIIGYDSLKKIKAYATQYSEPVYEDAEASFYHMANIKGVPFFATTDSKGNIKDTLSGGYASVAMMRQELGL